MPWSDRKRRRVTTRIVLSLKFLLILIFLQEGFKHGARLGTVLGEDISFPDIFCAFAARECGLVECHVANKIKRVEVLADLVGQRLKREAFVFEFFDDGLLTLGGFPALEEVIEAGETLLQCLLGEIP